jgi:hypothetical protein
MIMHQVDTINPDETNEIPLQEGELITDVVQTDEGWWEGTNSQGQRGLFPATYVEIKTHAIPASAPAPIAEPVPVPSSQSAPISKSAIAIYDYDAAEDNEITFVTGDTITEIDFVSDDWWSGTVRGRTGLFPGNYVELK